MITVMAINNATIRNSSRFSSSHFSMIHLFLLSITKVFIFTNYGKTLTICPTKLYRKNRISANIFCLFKKEEKNNYESSPLLHLIFKDSVLIIPDFHEGTEAYYLSRSLLPVQVQMLSSLLQMLKQIQILHRKDG